MYSLDSPPQIIRWQADETYVRRQLSCCCESAVANYEPLNRSGIATGASSAFLYAGNVAHVFRTVSLPDRAT